MRNIHNISIITPTYNRADELDYLINSISNQTIDLSNIELIISDDGSDDDTESVIRSWKEKVDFNILYINQKNKGPGAARNHGLENSSGDLIFFIDSDCEAHKTWIEIIIKEYSQNGFDACGGPDGAKNDFTLLQKAIDFSMTSFLTTGGIRGHHQKMIAKFYPRTHNMCITKEVYDRIGGFGSLRHGQDIEFSNRIKKAGFQIRFIKDALVYHRRRTSIRQFLKQVFNWGVARVNLGKIDSQMLEIVHFLPTTACLFSFFSIIIFIFLGWSAINIILIFLIPLTIVSFLGSIDKKELKIFPYLLIIIPIQVIGYGIGFFQAFIRRYILNQDEFVGFKKNYYK